MGALDPQADEEAMDLYCGAGTFTLPLARRAGFVSAVESYGPAVRDLRRNLERAGLGNVDAVVSLLGQPVDYERSNALLACERAHSRRWLHDAVFSFKRVHTDRAYVRVEEGPAVRY